MNMHARSILPVPAAEGSPTRPAAPRGAVELDLGHDPPLDVSGNRHPLHNRRVVSLRWLAASALVGAVGAALMASAVYVATEGSLYEVEEPEFVAQSVPAGPPAAVSGRKGDRLVASVTVPTAKQIVRAPMSHRVGDRETFKVRPYVRLATNLVLTTGIYANDIPPFNPLRMFAEGSEQPDRYGDSRADVPDADLSVVRRDIWPVAFDDRESLLSDEEVLAQIEEERRNAQSAGRRAPLPIPAQLMLGRTLRTAPDPAAQSGDLLAYAPPSSDTRLQGLDVRVVPENVTQVPKALVQAGREPLIDERTLVIRKGETFDQVMRANGLTPDQIRSVSAALSNRVKTAALPEGQVLLLMIAPGPREGSVRQAVRVTVISEGRIEAIAAVNDQGQFVAVAPPRDEETPKRKAGSGGSDEEDEEEEGGGSGPSLYEAFYETALKNEVPRALIDELVRIFAADVDFQRRVSGGDAMEIVYTEEDETDGSRREVLYASLSTGGETRRIFRYMAPDDGLIDYFDEEGRSLKKFLLRKPITEGEMRSGFGMRFHPILRYSKMHTGVDWANRVGTPILAAGNGTITKASWDSGYGRRVEIQHANGYVSTYSHMSAFGRNIQPGVRVRQGQVIGYLGSSGLSTGPHLHYEVMVNGNFVNPMKIRVPRGRELEGRTLAEFRRQRDEIEQLVVRAGGSRLARTAALR